MLAREHEAAVRTKPLFEALSVSRRALSSILSDTSIPRTLRIAGEECVVVIDVLGHNMSVGSGSIPASSLPASAAARSQSNTTWPFSVVMSR